MENVLGHLTLGFDQVLGDLAARGFDARWVSLRACDVGAPHARDRLFIVVADAERFGLEAGGQSFPGPPPVAGVDDCEFPFPAGWQGLKPGRNYGATFGRYTDAILRWEHVCGVAAPEPVMVGPRGNRVLDPRFVEWMMGLPVGWVSDVEGVTRKQALKALGNGVVPAQGEAALRILLNLEIS